MGGGEHGRNKNIIKNLHNLQSEQQQNSSDCKINQNNLTDGFYGGVIEISLVSLCNESMNCSVTL